jgi:hypothetical protein
MCTCECACVCVLVCMCRMCKCRQRELNCICIQLATGPNYLETNQCLHMRDVSESACPLFQIHSCHCSFDVRDALNAPHTRRLVLTLVCLRVVCVSVYLSFYHSSERVSADACSSAADNLPCVPLCGTLTDTERSCWQPLCYRIQVSVMLDTCLQRFTLWSLICSWSWCVCSDTVLDA